MQLALTPWSELDLPPDLNMRGTEPVALPTALIRSHEVPHKTSALSLALKIVRLHLIGVSGRHFLNHG